MILREHMLPYEDELRRHQRNDILREHMLPYEEELRRHQRNDILIRDILPYSDSPAAIAYCKNNPIMFVDPDGNAITLAKGFSTSAFGKTYSNLIKNNSAFNAALREYKNTTKFNVLFRTSPTQRGGFTDITKRAWPGKTPESADATTTFPNSQNVTDNMQYSEIGMVTVVAHEAIHLRIGSKDSRNEESNHNVFNAYFKGLTDILTEYNTDNSLGLSNNQIFELAISGQQDSSKFKSYINSLAKENGTTYKIEKENYDKRVSNLIYEKIPDAKVE